LAKGEGLSDAAMGAIREQIPGGDMGKAAFDAATHLARRDAVDGDMISVVRDALPPGTAPVFDTITQAAEQAVTPETEGFVPQGGGKVRQFSHMLHQQPDLHRFSVRRLAMDHGGQIGDWQAACANLLRHWSPEMQPQWHDVGATESLTAVADRLKIPGHVRITHGMRRPRGPHVRRHKIPKLNPTRDFLIRLGQHGSMHARKGIMKFGLLQRLARDTGELTGATQWTIRSGDTAVAVALKLTGSTKDASGNWTWKQLGAVNPGMDVSGSQPSPWNVGQVINVPPSWVGMSATPPATTPPAGTPPPQVAPPPVTSSGGPPFPPPSAYPAGYPGKTYTVVKNDTGSGIAQKITGNANRWKELLATNPAKADPTYGIAIYTGDVLTLPSSWQAPVAVVMPPPIAAPPKVSAPPTTTTTPPPAVVPTPTEIQVEGTQQQVMLIAAELSTFFAKHLDAKANVTPAFGTQASDSDGSWNTRISTALQGFQVWANSSGAAVKFTGKALDTDGLPDVQTLTALQAQTAADLPAVSGGGGSVTTTTTTPGGTSTTKVAPPGGRPPGPTPSSSSGGGGGAAVLAAALAAAAMFL